MMEVSALPCMEVIQISDTYRRASSHPIRLLSSD
jgi:hypothetical protein